MVVKKPTKTLGNTNMYSSKTTGTGLNEETKYYKQAGVENLPGGGRIEARFGNPSQVTKEEYDASQIPGGYREFTAEEKAQGHAHLNGSDIPSQILGNYGGGEGGTQQVQQPQGEQKKAGLMAKIGVAPAVVTANLMSKALKILSGGKLDIGTQSIEEFASKPIGKVLGTATTAAAGVLGGEILVGQLLAASGTNAAVGLTEEILTSPATLPNIVKGVLTKNGAIFKILQTTTGKLFVGGISIYGAYEGLSNKIQNDAKRAIASSRTSLTLANEGFKVGAVSYGEAYEIVDTVEAQINSYERSMKVWGTLSIVDFLSKSKDARVDAENAKIDVLIARQQLNQQVVNQVMGK